MIAPSANTVLMMKTAFSLNRLIIVESRGPSSRL